MLRLSGGQVESLFDLGLPVEVRELPADLAALDGLLADPALLGPVERAWDQAARGRGRPTVAMTVFVRLMVVKQRSGWGYETLVREVSDSLHLRRFCRIALSERVPDESTVRKLVPAAGGRSRRRHLPRGDHPRDDRRAALCRAGRADRLDGDRGRRSLSDRHRPGRRRDQGAGARGRHRRGPDAPRVRNRSRAIGRRQRKLNRTLAARTGQGKPTALRLTGEAGALVERSVREARRLGRASASPRSRARRAAQAHGCQAPGGIGRRVPARSPARSVSAWPARRSPTGWSPSPTPTPDRSARASCARRPNSAASSSSPSCARTPAAAPAG